MRHEHLLMGLSSILLTLSGVMLVLYAWLKNREDGGGYL